MSLPSFIQYFRDGGICLFRLLLCLLGIAGFCLFFVLQPAIFQTAWPEIPGPHLYPLPLPVENVYLDGKNAELPSNVGFIFLDRPASLISKRPNAFGVVSVAASGGEAVSTLYSYEPTAGAYFRARTVLFSDKDQDIFPLEISQIEIRPDGIRVYLARDPDSGFQMFFFFELLFLLVGFVFLMLGWHFGLKLLLDQVRKWRRQRITPQGC